MSRAVGPTVVDLLENALGSEHARPERIDGLTSAQIEELEDLTNTFYREYEPVEPPEGEMRAYFGGWVSGNVGPDALDYLRRGLLYAHSVVIHDLVGAWFYRDRAKLKPLPEIRFRGGVRAQTSEPGLLRSDGYHAFPEDLDRTRNHLKLVLPVLAELSPLIREGIVIPVPHLRVMVECQEGIMSAVRHDVRDTGFADLVRNPIDEALPRADSIRGGQVSVGSPARTIDAQRSLVQDPSYFLNKTLAIAAHSSSLYVPPAATDLALFEHRISELKVRQRLELDVIPALVAAELPFFEGVPSRTLLDIRKNESSLDDWRRELRNAIRSIEVSRTVGLDFHAEARDVLNDCLVPQAREVQKLASRTRGVTEGVSPLLFRLGAAAVFNAPGAAAIAAGASVMQWTYRALFPKSATGSREVLAALVRRAPAQ